MQLFGFILFKFVRKSKELCRKCTCRRNL